MPLIDPSAHGHVLTSLDAVSTRMDRSYYTLVVLSMLDAHICVQLFEI